MAKRKDRIRKWRACGKGRKHNKKSVAYRKQLKRLEARRLKKLQLFMKLPIEERRKILAEQAKKLYKHYEDLTEQESY